MEENGPSKITFIEYNGAILSRGFFFLGDFVPEPSDSSATAIGDLLQSLVQSNRKSAETLPNICYQKLKFQDRLMTDLTIF